MGRPAGLTNASISTHPVPDGLSCDFQPCTDIGCSSVARVAEEANRATSRSIGIINSGQTVLLCNVGFEILNNQYQRRVGYMLSSKSFYTYSCV